jgi:ribonucleotide monophosphatase NagD (HAD superfamily)
MVGDRPDTDIDGAIAADVDSLLVLTGVCTLADLAALPTGRRPSYVAADLRGLLEPHPPVEVDEDRATCVDAVARVDGDRVVLEQGRANTVAGLRAVVALAWATRDRGSIVSVEDVRMDA